MGLEGVQRINLLRTGLPYASPRAVGPRWSLLFFSPHLPLPTCGLGGWTGEEPATGCGQGRSCGSKQGPHAQQRFAAAQEPASSATSLCPSPLRVTPALLSATTSRFRWAQHRVRG